MKLKTKLALGIYFLFIVILVFGGLSLFYINRLNNESASILKNNHESLVYGNNMLKALEEIPLDNNATKKFDENLQLQENNITETGEKEATLDLRKNFTELLANKNDVSGYTRLRQGIQQINDLNQQAILKKNNAAKANADQAKFWLTVTFCILVIVTLTFSYNFPSVIATPVRKFKEAISEIAGKNYKKRIYLDSKDEFGDLAAAFNSMAEKLDEYEHSNLAQLRFEKSRIETVISQMKDAVIGLDSKNNILFLNAMAEKLLGLKELEIIGKYAPDVALRNDLMRTLLQPEDKQELKIYAGNKESYFNKDIIDVTSNNNIIGQVIVLKNITPFHELSEAKTNFIATVSHELKTPISSIKMSARLLGDNRVGDTNDEQTKLIKGITDDAERLLKITGELLNMSQVETGNIQMKLQPCSPAVIVQDALNAVTFKAQQRSIHITTDLPDTSLMVNADIEKTAWVLINFLTNAIRYSPEGGTINIRVYPREKDMIFEIADNGTGIDPKYLGSIFDRYFKVPGNNELSGTGLGLSISKEFIEAQGGFINAESVLGEGSKFSVGLKIA